jgi:hypothetical protein
MAWNRKYSALRIFISALFVITCAGSLHGQGTPPPTGKPVWTDEQWQHAKEGMEYTDTSEKKEEEKQGKEVDEDGSSGESPRHHGSIGDFLTSPTARFISILFILALLVFTIMRIMVSRGIVRNKKVAAVELGSIDDIEDDIVETDLERFLRMALETGDYKTAVRILYLMVIQRLHEMEWIRWKKDKTNHDYLKEMRSRKSFQQFRSLTLVYEIVWYGDTNISQSEFEKLTAVFTRYKSSLDGSENK